MDIRDFETALRELQNLADADLNNEDFYQQWFERNPVVFQSYGYGKVIPHPELTEKGIVLYIPDFLVQRLDGLWEIVEIKRPDTKVLTRNIRRQRFYASLDAYYSQCREYSRYFDDSANRQEFMQRYGIEVQRGLAGC